MEKKKYDNLEYRYRKCPICDKMYILPTENLYRLTVNGKRIDYCSYTCWIKAQEKYGIKRRRGIGW